MIDEIVSRTDTDKGSIDAVAISKGRVPLPGCGSAALLPRGWTGAEYPADSRSYP